MATKNKPVLLPAVILMFIIFGGIAYIAIKFSQDNVLAPAIAVVSINGGIDSGTSAGVTKILKKAGKDKEIKAVILEINSPGGTVVASKEIASAVKELDKPVVAWIREEGASGAYWIASASDKIVADPGSITGSIGVTGSYLEFSKLFDKYGVTYNSLTSGKYKDTGSQYKNLSDSDRSYLLGLINALKVQFVQAVAENRNLSFDYVNNLATGQVFLGTDAQNYKLVDVLGGRSEAQKTAEKLAGLRDSRLVEYGQQQSLFGSLSSTTETLAYWAGRGIGDSIKPQADSDIKLVAEI
ncbi:MAG: signal peptide peptidase SppA [DPANN group archaeon]|nr:signal peptide peptidase SppA [DPANN group archaeon]